MTATNSFATSRASAWASAERPTGRPPPLPASAKPPRPGNPGARPGRPGYRPPGLRTPRPSPARPGDLPCRWPLAEAPRPPTACRPWPSSTRPPCLLHESDATPTRRVRATAPTRPRRSTLDRPSHACAYQPDPDPYPNPYPYPDPDPSPYPDPSPDPTPYPYPSPYPYPDPNPYPDPDPITECASSIHPPRNRAGRPRSEDGSWPGRRRPAWSWSWGRRPARRGPWWCPRSGSRWPRSARAQSPRPRGSGPPGPSPAGARR